MSEYIKQPDGSYLLISGSPGGSNVTGNIDISGAVTPSIGDVKTLYNSNRIFTDTSGTWVAIDGSEIFPEDELHYGYLLWNFPKFFVDNNLVYKYMTSATTPEPQVVTTNNEYTKSYAAWYVFADKNVTNNYWTQAAYSFVAPEGGGSDYVGDVWVTIDIGEEFKHPIEGFSIKSNSFRLKDYQFIGSQDGDWENGVILVNIVGNTDSGGSTPRYHVVDDTETAYRFFTLRITKLIGTYNATSIESLSIWSTRKRLTDLTATDGKKFYVKVPTPPGAP
jgi:hypothetical protein